MKKNSSPQGASSSQQIDARIEDLDDWRGATLARLRKLIKDADPDVVEEWKWVKPTNPGVPVWSHDGLICTGETYKNVVKLTFAKGASLKDPSRLFNSSLEGKTRRAIDVHEGAGVGRILADHGPIDLIVGIGAAGAVDQVEGGTCGRECRS